MRYFLYPDSAKCTMDDAPSIPLERALTVAEPVADYHEGIMPELRPASPTSSVWVSSLVLIMLAATLYNLLFTRRLFASFFSDLFGIGKHKNKIEEPTVYESRAIIVMASFVCIVLGLWLAVMLTPDLLYRNIGAESMNILLLELGAVAVVWYMIHIIGYSVIGWTFNQPQPTAVWIRSFNLSMAIFALLAIFPITAAAYIPQIRNAMDITAAAIFILMLIIPIIKGFRIFYSGYASLLYFILYLFAIEIIPVASAVVIARMIIMSHCN